MDVTCELDFTLFIQAPGYALPSSDYGLSRFHELCVSGIPIGPGLPNFRSDSPHSLSEEVRDPPFLCPVDGVTWWALVRLGHARDAAMLAKRAFSAGEGRVVIEGSVDAGARVFTAVSYNRLRGPRDGLFP